ncbi:hypothetical protein GP5015_682 [gamma proteobacterium HTCC5015]|nr:hypothetical protein GP5015_682 [gamma proteobacterium HTCC5015]
MVPSTTKYCGASCQKVQILKITQTGQLPHTDNKKGGYFLK